MILKSERRISDEDIYTIRFGLAEKIFEKDGFIIDNIRNGSVTEII